METQIPRCEHCILLFLDVFWYQHTLPCFVLQAAPTIVPPKIHCVALSTAVNKHSLKSDTGWSRSDVVICSLFIRLLDMILNPQSIILSTNFFCSSRQSPATSLHEEDLLGEILHCERSLSSDWQMHECSPD